MRVMLYTANCKGNKKNCIYPNRCVIEDEVDFMAAVGYDHVCAWFDKSYRSTDNWTYVNTLDKKVERLCYSF